jgi:hypothetical protein
MIKNKKGGNMKEMTMPLNYVELEQEEMMYLEGGGIGYKWYNRTNFLAKAIDTAFAFSGLFAGAAAIFSIWGEISIGSIVVKSIDRIDGRYDGYVFP